MRILLTLLLVFACAQQAALAETMLVMVDGYCYLEGQSEHSETKVKFIKDSPSAITDSTYTDSSGYFFISDLYAGIYDVEYTHASFDTERVEDQVLVGSTTLPPVTLAWPFCNVDGYCYLENQTIHWGTKVKFAAVSPPAVTDSTYTDSSGYFIMGSLHDGTYDVEYTHEDFGTVLVEDQTFVSNTTLPSVTLPCVPIPLSGVLSGILGPGCYSIEGNISINSGNSLRLLPGTIFRFAGPYPFTIYGTLLAEGTESDSVVFTTEQSGSNRWRGMRFYPGSSGSRLAYCLIEKGYATGDSPSYVGGGVFCYDSSPTFTNCVISGNFAGFLAGGVYCGDSSPTFTNCTISGNKAATNGGGMYCASSSPTFRNCAISGNEAGSTGGGVSCDESSTVFTNCAIIGNSASGVGAGVVCSVSSPIFNSTIIAFSNGSGIYFQGGAASQIIYCDIFGNSGGNIVFLSGPSDGPPGIGQIVTTNANCDPCDVYRNIFLDPMFADTAADDFHLLDNSHCIGAGDSEDTVSTDFEGDPRPNPPGSFPDIGADENLNAQPPVGPCELSGPLGGQCILGPGVCHVIGEISVSAGESLILLPGTTLIFDGPYPFNIYGTLLAEGTESDSIVFTTDTLQNPDRWRGLHFLSGSDSSRLSYCLIERSQAVGDWPDNNGGGIYCGYSSPTLTNCTIAENSAGGGGGGVACREFASPTFTSCTFRENSAGIYGGGAYCYLQCSPVFTNCVFHQNSASTHGGGAYAGYMCSPTFTNCTMGENSATSYGGGAFSDNYSSPAFRSCTISRNSASYGGGAYSYGGSSPSFNNCLIDDNSASGRGGGVYGGYLSSPTLTHCTISRNSAGTFGGGMVCFQASLILSNSIIAFSNGSGIYFQGGSGGQALYCDIFGNSDGNIRFLNDDPSQGPPAIGLPVTINANADSADIYLNIFLDPTFADTAAGDFHLTDLSHCIGAGDPVDTVSTDFEGDPRPNPSWSFPDIGADEHWSGSPVLYLVVSISDGNARLHWTPFGAGPYYIYGATEPFAVGTLLGTISDTTTWTDDETASRPWRYFYYVTAEWPGR